MQTLKELLAEIEDLRSQVAVQDKKPRVPGKPPAAAAPAKAPGAAAALPAPQPVNPPAPAPMKLETWSPGQPKAPAAPTAPAPAVTPPPAPQPGDTAPAAAAPAPTATAGAAGAAKPSAVSPAGKAAAKAKAEAAAKEKARARLKEIATTAQWFSAKYAAASALDEKVSDTDLDAWLGKLKLQITTPATMDDGLEDAVELVRAARNKSVWKEEKAVPEDRKAHFKKAEQLLLDLLSADDAAHTKKVAEVLHENGTRGEVRMIAGKKLGMSETDIHFKEWTVRGKKLEQSQLEAIYNNATDWRQKWQAGKELGLKQAATDVYGNKDAEREDRLDASKMLGISAADFALHERELGKEITKEDLKHIWIGARDLEVRNAAAKELGHSALKIWMSEHPAVVVAAGTLLLIAVGAIIVIKPWRRHKKSKVAAVPTEQVQPSEKTNAAGNVALATSDAPAPADGPAPVDVTSEPGTNTSSEVQKAGPVKTTVPAVPDYPVEKIDVADILSGGGPAPKAKLDPNAAPPDLPDVPEDTPDQPADSVPPTVKAPETTSPAPAVVPPAATTAPAPVSSYAGPGPVPDNVPTRIGDTRTQPATVISAPATTVAARPAAATTATVVKATAPAPRPASPAIPVAVAKSTNAVVTTTNRATVKVVAPVKPTAAAPATGTAVRVAAPVRTTAAVPGTGTVVKAVAPVKVSTNAPKPVATVKSTAVVGTSSNKPVVKTVAPAGASVAVTPTGKVAVAVAPARVSTNAPRPVVAVRSTNTVVAVTNRVPLKSTVPATTPVAAPVTGKVVKATAPAAVGATQ